MKKIKLLLTSLMVAFSFALVPALAVSSAYAYDTGTAACNGANGNAVVGGAGCPTNDSSTSLPTIVGKIINIFSWVVGAVSVIMLIYGGFKYITSGGDSGGVTAAKNTILYAIVGLVIVALSQIIVNFVLTKANDAAGVTTVTTSSRLS